jgi:hypothetical protein
MLRDLLAFALEQCYNSRLLGLHNCEILRR